MTLEAFARKSSRVVRDNSPAILTALSVAGVVTTAYLAHQAGRYAWEDKYKASMQGQYDDIPFTRWARLKKDVQLTWKLYIPAVVMGGATIACTIGANSISSKRTAALVGAYSLSETAFREYREKMVEHIGPAKEQKVADEIAQDRVNKMPSSGEIVIVEGEVLCLDSITGRVFKANVEKLRKAQNDINAQCINDMYASQNDFYRLIGLPPVDIGEELGWNTDNMMDLRISAVKHEDKPVLFIEYTPRPTLNFHRVW